MYLVAGALIAAGLADFSLIGFHFQKANIIAPNTFPIFYAVAMATSALSGLLFGRLFDRFGRKYRAARIFSFRRICALCLFGQSAVRARQA